MVAEEFNHDSPVIVYNKSPFIKALLYVAVTALCTLAIQAQAYGQSVWEFFGYQCFNLFFVIVLPYALLNNKKLGDRISVDPDKSRIWVSHRGLRTDFKERRNGSVNYENSDFIRITKRVEDVHMRGSAEGGWTTFYDICLYRIDGSHKTIFSLNGWVEYYQKMKAVRIGKSIAQAAGLDYRKK